MENNNKKHPLGWIVEVLTGLGFIATLVSFYQMRMEILGFFSTLYGMINWSTVLLCDIGFATIYISFVYESNSGDLATAIKRAFPTHTLGGRFIAVSLLALVSYFIENLRPFFLLYNIYFVLLMGLSFTPIYHARLFKWLRIICDVFIAYLGVRSFGGVASPLLALFFIPLCSFARRYSGSLGVGWCLILVGILLHFYFKAGGTILPPDGVSLFSDSLNGLPDIFSPHMMPLFIRNLILLLGLSFVVISIVFLVERNRTFFAMLASFTTFVCEENMDIERAMLKITDSFRCEVAMYLVGNEIYYAFSPRKKRRNITIDYPSTGHLCHNDVPKVSEFVSRVDNIMQEPKTGIIAPRHFPRNVMGLLGRYALVPTEWELKFRNLAFAKVDKKSCLVLLNHFTNNRLTYRPFTLRLWYQVKLYSVTLKAIKE